MTMLHTECLPSAIADLNLGPTLVPGNTVVGGDGQLHVVPPDQDAQTLSIFGDIISLTNGGSVTLPAAPTQTLSVAGQTLSISGGNSVTLPDSDDQTLSISGSVISLTNGGSVTLPAAPGTDCVAVAACVAALPIGAPALAGDLVLGQDGEYHALPAGAAAPTLSVAGQTLSISGGNSVTLPDSDDQTLSITGQTLSISGGNSVTLPASATQDPYATPAETTAGTATSLIVNPADLYARENIAAQTGLANDVTLIPVPTASQSVWGTNLLGETVHYAPGLGWRIVAGYWSSSASSSAGVGLPANTRVQAASITLPRAGLVLVTGYASGFANPIGDMALWMFVNGVSRGFGAITSIPANQEDHTAGYPSMIVDVAAGTTVGIGGAALFSGVIVAGATVSAVYLR